MPCTSKTLLVVVLVFTCFTTWVHADNLTVEQAIEQAKQKKLNSHSSSNKDESNSAPVATALPSTLPSLSTKDTPSELPKLWSIKGAGDKLTAEIVDNGMVYSVALEKNSVFGQWIVVDFDSESVTLVQRTKIKKTKQKIKTEPNTTDQIKLTVSPVGSSISKFNLATEGEINTIQRQAASNLPVKPNSK